MKITLEELQKVIVTLREISKLSIGIVFAFKIVGILQQLAPYEKNIVEIRLKIARKYAKKDEKGNYILDNNRYTFNPECLEKFSEEFKKMLSEEVTVSCEMIYKEELLKYMKEIKPAYLLNINKFIKEDG